MTQGEMFSDLALEQQYDNMIKELDMKQETLEEAADIGKFAEKKYLERLNNFQSSDFKDGVFEGAKWQSERIENESEQLINELESLVKDNNLGESYRAGIMTSIWRIKKWFEQFKKK